jgi:hypothetical protein
MLHLGRKMKTRIMKRKKAPELEKVGLIKVQLDNRTVVFVKNMKAFKMWQERYPNAKIVD